MTLKLGKTQKPLFIPGKNEAQIAQPAYGTDMRHIENKVNGLNAAATTVTARVTTIENEITVIDGEIATLESQNPTKLPVLVHITGTTRPILVDYDTTDINVVPGVTLIPFNGTFHTLPIVTVSFGDTTSTTYVWTVRTVQATLTTAHFAVMTRTSNPAGATGAARRINWHAMGT